MTRLIPRASCFLPRRPLFVKWMSQTTSPSEMQDFDLAQFASGYPLVLDHVSYPFADESGTTSARKSLLFPTPSHWTWLEANILCPLRRHLSTITCCAFINRRFSKDGNYIKEGFMEGVYMAIPSLFSRLADISDPTSSSYMAPHTWSTSSQLTQIMSPKLLARFQEYHELLEKNHLALKVDIQPVEKMEEDTVQAAWITFGPSRIITSSILPGKVITRYNPLSVLRDAGRGFYLFRQLTLEYALDKNEGLGEPDADILKEAMDAGQIAAVDVQLNCNLSFTLVNTLDQQSILTQTLQRPVQFRFETSHFKGRDTSDVNWKIADIDYCLINERVGEFEAPPIEES